MIDLAAPRAPGAALSAALYESHYLTATDPAGGRALWLRHTALKRPGQPARPTVWLTWFDRDAPAPIGLRVTAEEPLAAPDAAWAASAMGSFGPVSASGAIGDAHWRLGWTGVEPELAYLPARWLYDRAWPRSGGAALVPAALVSGTVSLPGHDPVTLDGWRGMVGHNWGREHAARWLWLHGAGLGPAGRDWLDLVLVRVAAGPLLTPWIAAGAVSLDGARRRPAPGRRVEVTPAGSGTRVGLTLAGGGRLRLSIDAPSESTQSWDYAGPEGSGRTVRHCTVADAAIAVDGKPIAVPSASFAFETGGPARAA